MCDRIYDQVRERLQKVLDTEQGTLEGLRKGIANFFCLMDEMQNEVLCYVSGG